MIDWPDCLHGLSTALAAAWLSVKMMFRFGQLLCSASSAAVARALASAANTLKWFSPPRCCWVAVFVAGSNVAAPIFPWMPEPSVYMYRVVPRHVFCSILSCMALASSFVSAMVI